MDIGDNISTNSYRTGLLYYENFIKHFPDVITLSNASLDNILSVWKGLGYYRRA
jgi:A/G-specific adenine glycosylase